MACDLCGVPNSLDGSCTVKLAGGAGRKVWFAEACQIASYTLDGYNSKITAITMEAGEVFRHVTCKKNTVSGAFAYNATTEALDLTVTIVPPSRSDNADLDDAAQEAINWITDVVNASNPLVFIIEESDGTRRLWGYINEAGSSRGLEVATSDFTTGAAIGDLNATTITLTGPGPVVPPVLDRTFTIPE